MGQVKRSLVVLSVPLAMLYDGWLRHQRSGRQGYQIRISSLWRLLCLRMEKKVKSYLCP
jgi:hypothetical protein